MCEQPADRWGWWMHFIWCAGVSKFWWRLADGCRVWVLLQHYWLQGDRYAKESHLILRQAAVKHTPPHTSSSECACLPNTPPPPSQSPYRITDHNSGVRPGQKTYQSQQKSSSINLLSIYVWVYRFRLLHCFEIPCHKKPHEQICTLPRARLQQPMSDGSLLRPTVIIQSAAFQQYGPNNGCFTPVNGVCAVHNTISVNKIALYEKWE